MQRDNYYYKGRSYVLLSHEGFKGFDPEEYRIFPLGTGTGVFSFGYWCTYTIDERGLLLNNLYINAFDGEYPKIHGVRPTAENGAPKLIFGYHVYENLELELDYTGKLLLGAGKLEEYDPLVARNYGYIALPAALQYAEVRELTFRRGELIAERDHSDSLLEIHDALDHNKDLKAWFIMN